MIKAALACGLLMIAPLHLTLAGEDEGLQKPVLKRTFKTERSDVGMPGAGKIVLGFVIVIALGAGAIALLRRIPRKYWLRESASGSIRVLDRATVSPTLRVYLVQTEGARIMIAEGRAGVGFIELAASGSPTSASTP